MCSFVLFFTVHIKVISCSVCLSLIDFTVHNILHAAKKIQIAEIYILYQASLVAQK